jgi:alkylation response protein AidB-like acyl-CoA dehydrogenase
MKGARRRVEGVKARICDACGAFLHDRANAVLPIALAKLAACNTSMEVVQEMMQLVGGSSIFEAQFPYGRWLGDAAVGLLMPPSQSRCLEVIARIAKREQGVTLLEFA